MEGKAEIIGRLRKGIQQLEGCKPKSDGVKQIIGIKAIEAAFPDHTFPVGVIHELLTGSKEQAAASVGFTTALLAALMKNGAACLWISAYRTVFPPALKAFGIEPDKIIFINAAREKNILWVMEEALKCEGLAAVIAEVKELSFMQSRRLQLAVEHSKVTGFVFRSDLRKLCTTVCAARWQITPIPSELKYGIPGVGFPRWQVELLKIRNGRPGSWKVEWSADRLALINEHTITIALPGQIRKVG